MQKFRGIEKKIRSSMEYHDWVLRNKAAFCLHCGSTERLECHHVVPLYSYISGAWRIYGNEEQTINHVLSLHVNDKPDDITLCDTCHSKQHPLGHITEHSNETVNVSNWTTFPRNMKCKFVHWKLEKNRIDALGLISLQTLFGIGWYILNGYMNANIIDINRRKLAQLLGKTPGTSFNKSLDVAMYELFQLNIINAHKTHRNEVEIHLSQSYLNALLENPWFISIDDVKTEKMCTLTLKWWLSFQSNRVNYFISLQKLTEHLCIKTNCAKRVSKAILSASKEIPWAKLEMKKNKLGKDLCVFKFDKRGATPIDSLRRMLDDSIYSGKK